MQRRAGVVRGSGGVVDRDPGGGDGDQCQGEKANDHRPPSVDGPPARVAADVKEVAFGLAERRVAGRVGAVTMDGR